MTKIIIQEFTFIQTDNKEGKRLICNTIPTNMYKEMKQLENHQSVNTVILMDSVKNHQKMLKWLNEIWWEKGYLYSLEILPYKIPLTSNFTVKKPGT